MHYQWSYFLLALTHRYYMIVSHRTLSTTIAMINFGQICTHEWHPIPHPNGWAMGYLLWVIWQKMTKIYLEHTLTWCYYYRGCCGVSEVMRTQRVLFNMVKSTMGFPGQLITYRSCSLHSRIQNILASPLGIQGSQTHVTHHTHNQSEGFTSKHTHVGGIHLHTPPVP